MRRFRQPCDAISPSLLPISHGKGGNEFGCPHINPVGSWDRLQATATCSAVTQDHVCHKNVGGHYVWDMTQGW